MKEWSVHDCSSCAHHFRRYVFVNFYDVLDVVGQGSINAVLLFKSLFWWQCVKQNLQVWSDGQNAGPSTGSLRVR